MSAGEWLDGARFLLALGAVLAVAVWLTPAVFVCVLRWVNWLCR